MSEETFQPEPAVSPAIVEEAPAPEAIVPEAVAPVAEDGSVTVEVTLKVNGVQCSPGVIALKTK